MSFVFLTSSIAPLYLNQSKLCNLNSQGNDFQNQYCSFGLFGHRKVQWNITENICTSFRNKSHSIFKSTARCMKTDVHSFTEENTISLDWDDQEDIEDTGKPWEGAIIYKRNPSISHIEYCTTLERIGLGKLSTEVSKSRASIMGLRVTKAVKDFPLGTPVQVSVDVTRKKKKLRLDGIIKTVITLGCNRCGEPAAECIFSDFSLLLAEDPIEEPEIINMGLIFGEDRFKSTGNSDEDGDDDEASIDLDDRLHFPLEDKEIDISKHIRDRVHLEITINAICDPSCKGLCLKCGTNLNTSSCICSNHEVKGKGFGPLGNLKKQMQQR
ncbi:DUF177 domain-containing protein [Quillaja saponaria]|uniref:DUF177 domain-containing protein n=1 Tax=Quillaja saponaria TaxID=32244 RepID=A0AAD7LKE2_QUISA|nr:DUF177 domain-containing protein [Quillaja saponaria]